jgi:hypothetical protein
LVWTERPLSTHWILHKQAFILLGLKDKPRELIVCPNSHIVLEAKPAAELDFSFLQSLTTPEAFMVPESLNLERWTN